MAVALPRFVAFRTKSEGYVMRLNRTSSVKRLRFDRDEMVIPEAPSSTKFELIPAATGQFTHIRCCYNNKYLVKRNNNSGNVDIVANADEPEEDQSKWTCTLFRISNNFSLLHVHTSMFASMTGTSASQRFLSLTTSQMRFDLIDWESILLFPDYIVLKSDNDKNLRLKAENGGSWSLAFTGDEDDIGDQNVIFWTQYAKDGSLVFRTIAGDTNWDQRLWMRVPSSVAANDHIWARGLDTRPNRADPDYCFKAIKAPGSTNKVVLQNLANRKFCRRFTPADRTPHLFCANSNSSTVPYAAVEIREAAFSKSVHNVSYRLNDAIIYNEQPTLLTRFYDAVNDTSMQRTRTMTLSYELTESSRWEHSIGVQLGVKTSFRARIPFIKFGKFSLSTSVDAGYERQWGKTETTTKKLEVEHFVVVPPRTKVRVRLIATEGMCDVPFSYIQREVVSDGQQRIVKREDGVYTGVNTYNFKYETTSEALP